MNYQETMNCVKLAIDAGITPMVWGAPGTGKTAMSKELITGNKKLMVTKGKG